VAGSAGRDTGGRPAAGPAVRRRQAARRRPPDHERDPSVLGRRRHLHTWGMFGKKVQAEALILDDEGSGHVSFDPKSHKTEIHIEGDPRYDPKLIRVKDKQDRAARAGALLNGAPVPAASGVVHVVHHVVDDEPRWQVPATCPECGARVDQSTAAFAEHPACAYCAKPLPRAVLDRRDVAVIRIEPSRCHIATVADRGQGRLSGSSCGCWSRMWKEGLPGSALWRAYPAPAAPDARLRLLRWSCQYVASAGTTPGCRCPRLSRLSCDTARTGPRPFPPGVFRAGELSPASGTGRAAGRSRRRDGSVPC